LNGGHMQIDCLYTGNVSESQAKNFFNEATRVVHGVTNQANTQWLPGSEELRLESGKDIELHFASQNEQEENGAVLMTYQSQIPGFRGAGLSPDESLKSTASIRLICHMLREPLFNTLRTKQQLGYIVSSYYDSGISTPRNEEMSLVTTPIDFIAINVLSRKITPVEITERIDEFLSEFRKSLHSMPESEIRDHAAALKEKLLKPIQKLGTEASTHMTKIRRYGPETLSNGGKDTDLPWDTAKHLASSIGSLDRDDLISTWDRVVLSRDRSRVVSMVYGKTFPLDERLARRRSTTKQQVIVNEIKDAEKLRKKLQPFDNRVPKVRTPLVASLPLVTNIALGVAAVAVVGAVGVTIMSKRKR